MLPLVKREISARGWANSEEFLDMLGVAQSLPGVMIVNVASLVGYRVSGPKGAASAALGAVLPPFLTILAVASFVSNAAGNPFVHKFFCAVRPAAVGLIVSALAELAVSSRLKPYSLAFALLVALAMTAGVPPAWVIAAALISGTGYTMLVKR